jgi:hypothetical protein
MTLSLVLPITVCESMAVERHWEIGMMAKCSFVVYRKESGNAMPTYWKEMWVLLLRSLRTRIYPLHERNETSGYLASNEHQRDTLETRENASS